MRELFKDVEINGRKFRVSKFDALTGSYIIYSLLTQILPMGLGAQIEGLEADPSLPPMSKDKFMEIQKDCLKKCAEIKMVGDSVVPIPILMLSLIHI